jgi:hypothetical protein
MKEKVFKAIGWISVIVGIVLLVNTTSDINKFYNALYVQTENLSLMKEQDKNLTASDSESFTEKEIQYKNAMFKQINPPSTINSKIYITYLSIFLIAVGLIPLRNNYGGSSKTNVPDK